MINLMFLDLNKVERQKKHAELQTICKTFAVDGPSHFEAERCTLYFKDSDDKFLWTFAKRWQLSDAQLTEFRTFTDGKDYIQECAVFKEFDKRLLCFWFWK